MHFLPSLFSILNVFVKPNEQCRACSDIVMARKRTFEERKKNNLHCIHNAQLPYKLNRHLPYSQPFQTAKPSRFKSYFGKHCTPFTSIFALAGAKRVPYHAINHLKSTPMLAYQLINVSTNQLINLPTSHL